MEIRGSIRWCAGAMLGLAVGPALAGSIQFGESTDVDYKLTFNYALGMRTKNPDDAIINGPVDRFQASVLPDGATTTIISTLTDPAAAPNQRIVGFSHTGLPDSINFDDGDRNFRAGDLFNNRLGAFGEVHIKHENYGFLANGTAFYDQVFHRKNANNSPRTVNKYGPNDEFTGAAKYYNGERMRVLEAYAYGDFQFGDESGMNLRLGKHLAAWGESLFFPGITSAQGPNDATKAFVPGAEIKEILLPVNQISTQIAITNGLTALGLYQFEFKPTEIFPAGDFFSPADVVGPGAEFVYGSVNPAYANGCPGLFDPATPLEVLCNQGGLGGAVFQAGPYIIVPRGPDIVPSKWGNWGTGLKWSVTDNTTLGLFFLRYTNHNPSVQLNPGYAVIGKDPAGNPITTQSINQIVPVSYNLKYFGGIHMAAMSWSTVVGIFNVAGEFIYRDGIDTAIEATISGVRSPVATRARTEQANISAIYASNPKLLWYDEIAVVVEAAYLRVRDVDPVPPSPGIEPAGNGDKLFYDRGSLGADMLILAKSRDIIPAWDFITTIQSGSIFKGTPSVPGTFGALFGEHDTRLAVSIGMQYLQNLEFDVGYNFFFGDPAARVHGTLLHTNPYADRDNVTFNVKYSL